MPSAGQRSTPESTNATHDEIVALLGDPANASLDGPSADEPWF
ncbi:MAG: hypothetical protein ACHQWU_07845 [Gemmatimonadales bacterium]